MLKKKKIIIWESAEEKAILVRKYFEIISEFHIRCIGLKPVIIEQVDKTLTSFTVTPLLLNLI